MPRELQYHYYFQVNILWHHLETAIYQGHMKSASVPTPSLPSPNKHHPCIHSVDHELESLRSHCANIPHAIAISLLLHDSDQILEVHGNGDVALVDYA